MSLRCTFIDHGTGGAPDCLRLAEREMAAPAGRQVLIEVAYAGVNRPDVLQRSGSYPPPPVLFATWFATTSTMTLMPSAWAASQSAFKSLDVPRTLGPAFESRGR